MGSPTGRDCPECRAIDSVIMGLCSVCFAEFGEGVPLRIGAGLSWDLDTDEPLPERPTRT